MLERNHFNPSDFSNVAKKLWIESRFLKESQDTFEILIKGAIITISTQLECRKNCWNIMVRKIYITQFEKILRDKFLGLVSLDYVSSSI